MSLRAFARVTVIIFFVSKSHVFLFLSPTLPLSIERHRGLVRLQTSSTPKHSKYNVTAHSTPYQVTRDRGFWKGNPFSLNNCNLIFSLRVLPKSVQFKTTKKELKLMR